MTGVVDRNAFNQDVVKLLNRANFDKAVASDKARKSIFLDEQYDEYEVTSVAMFGATVEAVDSEAAGIVAYASMAGGGFAAGSSGGAAGGSSGGAACGSSGGAAGLKLRDASLRSCGLPTCVDFFTYFDVHNGVESEHRKPCREFPDPLLLCLVSCVLYLCAVAMSDTSDTIRHSEVCTQQELLRGREE